MKRLIAVIVLHVAFVCVATTASGVTVSVETGTAAMAVFSPAPGYPYEARKWHMSGSGLFVLRIDIKSGTVKRVTVAKSTGHKMLDNETIAVLKRWRFQPGKLPPISQLLPDVADSFRDTDSLAKVPVTFVLRR